jgi:hypothetical protein
VESFHRALPIRREYLLDGFYSFTMLFVVITVSPARSIVKMYKTAVSFQLKMAQQDLTLPDYHDRTSTIVSIFIFLQSHVQLVLTCCFVQQSFVQDPRSNFCCTGRRAWLFCPRPNPVSTRTANFDLGPRPILTRAWAPVAAHGYEPHKSPEKAGNRAPQAWIQPSSESLFSHRHSPRSTANKKAPVFI